MPCDKCNGIMVIGKNNNDSELWCPQCDGIEIIGKEETKRSNETKLELNKTEIMDFLSKYDKDSIIGTLGSFLEFKLSNGIELSEPYFRLICSIGYAIRTISDTDNSNFGNVKLENDPDVQKIIELYDFELYAKYLKESLINDDYLIEIISPQKYTENELDLKDIIISKFTENYSFNKLVLARYGLYDANDLKRNRGPHQWTIRNLGYFDEQNELSRSKYLFQNAAGLSNISKGVEEQIHLIDAVKQISTNFTELTTNKVEKSKIIEILSEISDKPEEIFLQLKNVNFPLIVESDCSIFVFPQSCTFYLKQINARKYSNDLNKERNAWGGLLEKIVFNVVELGGYEVINPKTYRKLLNFHVIDKEDLDDNCKPKKKEIDVSGFTDKEAIIIECKHWDIGSKFFLKDAIEERKEKLENELIKFQRKIELLKNDKEFDFLSVNKKIRCIMVTLHPEPIEKYGDIDVIPFNKFSPHVGVHTKHTKIRSDAFTVDNLISEFGISKLIHSLRTYESGNYLGIDFTQTLNLYPIIPSMKITPDTDFEPFTFIGDAIVCYILEDELALIPIGGLPLIIDLVKEDLPYLESNGIIKGSTIRFQVTTIDPIFGEYRFLFAKNLNC